MEKYTIDFQLAPAHMHRKNTADRAIRTCKNNLISGLSTTDTDFSISKWDRLLYQRIITLNLIHDSRANPALSAYAYRIWFSQRRHLFLHMISFEWTTELYIDFLNQFLLYFNILLVHNIIQWLNCAVQYSNMKNTIKIGSENLCTSF